MPNIPLASDIMIIKGDDDSFTIDNFDGELDNNQTQIIQHDITLTGATIESYEVIYDSYNSWIDMYNDEDGNFARLCKDHSGYTIFKIKLKPGTIPDLSQYTIKYAQIFALLNSNYNSGEGKTIAFYMYIGPSQPNGDDPNWVELLYSQAKHQSWLSNPWVSMISDDMNINETDGYLYIKMVAGNESSGYSIYNIISKISLFMETRKRVNPQIIDVDPLIPAPNSKVIDMSIIPRPQIAYIYGYTGSMTGSNIYYYGFYKTDYSIRIYKDFAYNDTYPYGVAMGAIKMSYNVFGNYKKITGMQFRCSAYNNGRGLTAKLYFYIGTSAPDHDEDDKWVFLTESNSSSENVVDTGIYPVDVKNSDGWIYFRLLHGREVYDFTTLANIYSITVYYSN